MAGPVNHPSGSFPTVQLSHNAHSLIGELKVDAFALGSADTPEAIHTAHARLSVSLKSISELFSEYERHLGIQRDVTVRF